MRKPVIVLLVAAASLSAATSAGGTNAAPRRMAAGVGISVRVPPGWHLIQRPLTDVTEPAQRLAVASFAVRLAPNACECGMPNIRHLPRTGAFVFVWEYPAPSNRAKLIRVPRRPAHFRVAQQNPHWFECAGPSWGTSFRDAQRVFQVEVYLGPAAGPNVRAHVDALLDSFHAAPTRDRATG